MKHISRDINSELSRYNYRLTYTFDIAVIFYQIGAIIALIPVAGNGWSLALTRFFLISSSVVGYFLITRLFSQPIVLKYLVLAIIGIVTLIAILGTAQVKTSANRLNGFNYQVYSFFRQVIPIDWLPQVHQNVLAGFLVTFLPFAVAFVIWGGSWWSRIYGLICCLIITLGVITTASRSAQISLIVIALIISFFLLATRGKVLYLVIIAAGIAFVSGIFYSFLNNFSYIDSNGIGRLDLWRSTISLIGDYPITGAGLGQFENKISEYATPSFYGSLQPHAHNLLLQSWVELGIFGFFGIVLSLFLTIRLLVAYFNLKTINPLQRPIFVGAITAIISLYANGFTEYGSWGGKFAPAFWIAPGILAGCGLKLVPLHLPFSKKFHSRTKRFFVLGIAVILFLLFVPWGILNIAILMPSDVYSTPLLNTAAFMAPWDGASERQLGTYYLRQNDINKAETHFNEAVKRNSNDWISLIKLGDLADKQGNSTLAIKYWKAAKASPYFQYLANLNYTNYELMEKNLLTALAIDPYNSAGIISLVDLYTKSGRVDKALETLNSYIENTPTANLYIKAAGLTPDANRKIEYLNKAIKLEPENSSLYWYLGSAYESTKQLEQAEVAYKKSYVLHPTSQISIESLARVYVSQGRTSDAIASIETFLSSNFFVDNPSYLCLYLAQIYLTQGNSQAALDSIEKAIRFNQNNIQAYLLKGDTKLSIGDKNSAQEAYQKALQLSPSNERALKGLDKLNKS